MSDETGEIQYRLNDDEGWTHNMLDRAMAERIVIKWRESGRFPGARVEQRRCGLWSPIDA